LTVNVLELVTETQVLVNLADRLPHVAIVQRFTAYRYISVELFLLSEELEHKNNVQKVQLKIKGWGGLVWVCFIEGFYVQNLGCITVWKGEGISWNNDVVANDCGKNNDFGYLVATIVCGHQLQ
jgi:hypothetical protein